MAEYTLNINGEQKTVTADPDTPLLWVIRDNLKLVGTKYGCGIGQCGTCMLHIDDMAIPSCTVPISNIGNSKIITIEGLSKDGTHPVQLAWKKHDVPQCGYCQPGQIMTVAALLKQNRNPSNEEINIALHGNICRCGTYNRIKAAIKTAASS